MKKLLLIILFFGQQIFAQTVSTYFSDPTVSVTDAVIFDNDGNLFGSDFGYNFDGVSVYKITPGGVVSTFVTDLSNPNGLAFDSLGNLFVVEYSAGNIHKYDANGVLLETFNVGGFPSGLIKDFNSDDMIYTQTQNNSINRLSFNGTITELAQGSPLNVPVGLAYDDNGNLFSGNYVGREIYKITASGPEFIATVPGDNGASLAFITYANQKLWGTTFFGDNKIYSINPNGIDDFTLFAGSVAGSDDGDISVATFTNPSGIIFNPTDNSLYVSEFSEEGNIRKILGIPLSENSLTLGVDIALSPNPTSNILEIKGISDNALEQTTIRIYDFIGRLISEKKYTFNDFNFKITIDVSKFSTGIYNINIQTSNRLIVSRKFIKK